MSKRSTGKDTLVRAASSSDLPFIVDCNRAMAAETEDAGLDEAVLKKGISYLLENPAEGFYLVAENQGQLAGTLMVTFEWSDWRAGRFWWIQSVFVTPENRRKGVYSALHEAVRTQAKTDSLSCGIRLYVEQDNKPAQQTYRQLGMYETHYRLFEELFSPSG